MKRVHDNRVVGSADLELGQSFMKIYGLSYGTTNLRAGAGVQAGFVAAYFTAEGGAGSLPHGLGVSHGAFGFSVFLRPLTFLRVGGGPHRAYLHIDRATTGAGIDSISLGASGEADLDVLGFGERGDHGIFLGARIDADMYKGNDENGPVAWGPELHVGARY